MGLGDRHTKNILLNCKSGEVLHIDFDCIFNKGKTVSITEIAPIRLTKNIEACMGAFKSFGLFKFYF